MSHRTPDYFELDSPKITESTTKIKAKSSVMIQLAVGEVVSNLNSRYLRLLLKNYDVKSASSKLSSENNFLEKND